MTMMVKGQYLINSIVRYALYTLGSLQVESVLNEDLTHKPRRYSEEMAAVLPVGSALAGQPHISFMDQSRTLQRVISTFPAQISAGQLTQLRVYQWDERL